MVMEGSKKGISQSVGELGFISKKHLGSKQF
jgi:hypothetical protein